MVKKVFNLIILDESGSMEALKPTTISGFNELLQFITDEAQTKPSRNNGSSLILEKFKDFRSMVYFSLLGRSLNYINNFFE